MSKLDQCTKSLRELDMMITGAVLDHDRMLEEALLLAKSRLLKKQAKLLACCQRGCQNCEADNG